ncbi:MAG: hypothetical protein D6722_27165 [Bacteroidetes bacterium]|nr:MAG: hypothetical protein D6722_27165 [Bacteroidota bacterium]
MTHRYLIRWGLGLWLIGFSLPLLACPTGTEPPGRIIRIAGQLVEQATGRPLSRATVMVQLGSDILANKQCDAKGHFVLYIPPEKVGTDYIDIKIRYREHVFLKREVAPVSQELRVEINRAILREEMPIGDYSMPFHLLEEPRVGRVLVRQQAPVSSDLHRLPAAIN